MKKKAIFFCFLDFPGAVRALQKRAKRPEKCEKGRFRPISRIGGQTPLKRPFVTPPFAALQLRESETTIKIKFAHFRGGLGRGAGEENCPKRYFSWETS